MSEENQRCHGKVHEMSKPKESSQWSAQGGSCVQLGPRVSNLDTRDFGVGHASYVIPDSFGTLIVEVCQLKQMCWKTVPEMVNDLWNTQKFSRGGASLRTPANALCTASPASAAHFNSLEKKSIALDTRRLILVPTIGFTIVFTKF